jgi:vacuolar-type H+-ATPase catalytic subunit A/Vma1
MIKKVDNINMVPDDIKELLLPDKGELVAIGNTVYELQQFPVKKYFELLNLMSKYFTEYNSIYQEKEDQGIIEFFGKLAAKLQDLNLVEELMDTIFPDIGDDKNKITFDQLKYLLGVIYKLNFLSRNHQIQNMETRAAYNKMIQMLGINMMTA